MPRPKSYVFDLDGTLIHSAPDLQAALNVALGQLERDPVDLATTISFIGNGVEKLVARGLRATGGCSETLHRAALEAFLQSYAQNMTTLTRPYPGVVDALARLRANGHRLGICTNKPTAPAVAICDTLGLRGYFDVIQGAEPDLTKKPDPAPLLRTIAALKVSPAEVTYIGDSEIDYQTARNANVRFQLFSGGYLHHPLPDLCAADQFEDWALWLVSQS